MCESGVESVVMLLAVADATFANAVLRVLRTCAPFPIRAAVTNSVEQALSHLSTAEVEIALVDLNLGVPKKQISIEKIREITSVPTIVFTPVLTRDVDERLRRLGADAVLPRTEVDPLTLLETVQRILKANCNARYEQLTSGSRPKIARQVITADEAHVCSSHFKAWVLGADRLKQVLSREMLVPEPHRRKLRDLLLKPKE